MKTKQYRKWVQTTNFVLRHATKVQSMLYLEAGALTKTSHPIDFAHVVHHLVSLIQVISFPVYFIPRFLAIISSPWYYPGLFRKMQIRGSTGSDDSLSQLAIIPDRFQVHEKCFACWKRWYRLYSLILPWVLWGHLTPPRLQYSSSYPNFSERQRSDECFILSWSESSQHELTLIHSE